MHRKTYDCLSVTLPFEDSIDQNGTDAHVSVDNTSARRAMLHTEIIDGKKSHKNYKSPEVWSSHGHRRRFVIIDDRVFSRDCLQRSFQSSFRVSVETYSTLVEMETHNGNNNTLPSLILLSISNDDGVDVRKLVLNADQLAPGVPTIAIFWGRELNSLSGLIESGVKGCIPMTIRFDIAIQAVRFVLAGGTYFPAESIRAASSSPLALLHGAATRLITDRELAVIRAIQQGKPNKIIAHELNVCESTVKAHLRHIMRKLGARNRTEVAVKSVAG